MTRTRAWLLALAAAAAMLLGAAAVAPAETAAPSLTDEFSAADQYVESVPTARGPKAPGVGKQRQKREKLPQRAQAGLESQPEQTARKLEQIATSPELGAPVVNRDRKGGKRRSPSSSVPRVPAATVSAVGEGEEDTLLWLAVAMIVIAAAAAGTTAHRHHKRRNTAS